MGGDARWAIGVLRTLAETKGAKTSAEWADIGEAVGVLESCVDRTERLVDVLISARSALSQCRRVLRAKTSQFAQMANNSAGATLKQIADVLGS